MNHVGSGLADGDVVGSLPLTDVGRSRVRTGVEGAGVAPWGAVDRSTEDVEEAALLAVWARSSLLALCGAELGRVRSESDVAHVVAAFDSSVGVDGHQVVARWGLGNGQRGLGVDGGLDNVVGVNVASKELTALVGHLVGRGNITEKGALDVGVLAEDVVEELVVVLLVEVPGDTLGGAVAEGSTLGGEVGPRHSLVATEDGVGQVVDGGDGRVRGSGDRLVVVQGSDVHSSREKLASTGGGLTIDRGIVDDGRGVGSDGGSRCRCRCGIRRDGHRLVGVESSREDVIKGRVGEGAGGREGSGNSRSEEVAREVHGDEGSEGCKMEF